MKGTAKKHAVPLAFMCHLTTNKLHLSLYLYTASVTPKQLGFSLSVPKHFFYPLTEFIYNSLGILNKWSSVQHVF